LRQRHVDEAAHGGSVREIPTKLLSKLNADGRGQETFDTKVVNIRREESGGD